MTEDLTVTVPDGSLTIIVGPNGCGKSTMLKALARLISPIAGTVILDGADIARYRTREVARRLAILPQASVAPEGIRVAELVARGRYPHQGFLRQWTEDDETAVRDAMRVTDISDLSGRPVDTLSGGQRQRVWIATALAQQTPLLLLDEPTTYLDITHQIDVLDLCHTLNEAGRTLAVVLHDLNHACRYATHLIAMKDGAVVAAGRPQDIVTEDLISEVFGLDAVIVADPVAGTPMVVPGPGRRWRART
nr:ABC transporter ATP-binding protein [Micromonospora craniellae]